MTAAPPSPAPRRAAASAPAGTARGRSGTAPTRPGGVSVWAAPHVPMATALQDSQTLASLLQRVRLSRERLQAVAVFLPAGLRPAIEAGPLDDEEWVLLVDNAATGAKLRQLLPRLQTVLAELGWPPREIKVRVQPRR